MADRYIDSTYIQSFLGSGYEAAAIAISGVVRNTVIEAATSVIQTALRNSGYSAPSTTDPTTVEEFVKLAVLGCYREMLSSVPEGSIPLPEAWATNPAKIAYAAILSGDARLVATPSVSTAVGAWLFTLNDPDDENATRTQRASRSELEGW